MFGFFRKKKPRQLPVSDHGTMEQIVPRIKHSNFLAAIEEMAQQRPDMKDRPVTTPFVADLLITFAFDLPETYQMVMTHDLKRLNVTAEDVRRQAIASINSGIPNAQFVKHPQESRVLLIQTGNHMEACMLLVDAFCNKVASTLPSGQLIAAVPTRDVLLLTYSDCEPALDVLRDLIRHAADLDDRTHNLSGHLLAWDADHWVSHEEVAAVG